MKFIYLSTLLFCVVIEFPSDVITCSGREARFFCFVKFTSGTPSGASWIQNSGTNVSTLPGHVVFDNSSSSSSLPAIVNNTLLITNVSFASTEYGYTYSCQQGDMMSDPASLTIALLVSCVSITNYKQISYKNVRVI